MKTYGELLRSALGLLFFNAGMFLMRLGMEVIHDEEVRASLLDAWPNIKKCDP